MGPDSYISSSSSSASSSGDYRRNDFVDCYDAESECSVRGPRPLWQPARLPPPLCFLPWRPQYPPQCSSQFTSQCLPQGPSPRPSPCPPQCPPQYSPQSHPLRLPLSRFQHGERSKGHVNLKESWTQRPTKVKYDPNSLSYDMRGRKSLYIFQSVTDPPALLEGSENDVKKLYNTFSRIGFSVAEPYRDYTHSAIINELQNIRRQDHKFTSCIAIVIMAHGHKGDLLEAADGTYKLKDVIIPFLKAPELAGKPKLFFINSCRGSKRDPGLQVDYHSYGKTKDKRSITIPTHSDCLIMSSSFEGYVSYGSSNNSWMIEALCDVIDDHYNDLHILELMTLVNDRVMRNFATSPNPLVRSNKQIPEVRFTLTKFLKFSKS